MKSDSERKRKRKKEQTGTCQVGAISKSQIKNLRGTLWRQKIQKSRTLLKNVNRGESLVPSGL